MNAKEHYAQELTFLWEEKRRITYDPIHDSFTFYDDIPILKNNNTNCTLWERESFFKTMLNDPNCYKAVREWWEKLNADSL